MKPSTAKYTKMITGPRVDICVGAAKKHYCLPKLLLCYYSDSFESCFNGKLIEGGTQKLCLPEDNVADFEILLEYMLHGVGPGPLVVKSTGMTAVKRCMDFIAYADKYNLGAVCDGVIYKPLRTALTKSNSALNTSQMFASMNPPKIQGSDIELTFRVTPEGSQLRILVAQAALSAVGVHGTSKFAAQEKQIDGFATELRQQLIGSLRNLKWKDPLTEIMRND